jgi:hypothetical protein
MNIEQRDSTTEKRLDQVIGTDMVSMVGEGNGYHKMVVVEYRGLSAWIDEGIAPLIRELWRAGIDTVMSCEENRPGWMWIEFAHATGAEEFLSIVARYETGIDTLYNRIRHGWDPGEGDLLGQWEYDALPTDLAVTETEKDGYIEESCSGRSRFLFTFSVRFPATDYPTLLARMTKHNRNARGRTLCQARR